MFGEDDGSYTLHALSNAFELQTVLLDTLVRELLYVETLLYLASELLDCYQDGVGRVGIPC